MTDRSLESQLKVAHILRRLSPAYWGGVESSIIHLCQQLEAKGIDSTIYCTDMLAPSGYEILENVKVRRFSYCFPWFGLSKNAKHALELKGGSPLSISLFLNLLREPNLSLIHSHTQLRMGGIARTVARLRRIPYIVTIHGGFYTLTSDLTDPMREPVKGKIEWGKVFGWLLGSRRTLEDADAIICVGRKEFDEVKRRFPNKRIRFIPNGLNVSAYQVADPELFRREIQLGPNEKLVLCVSRIDDQKNQLLLVRAFARLLSDFPNYRLALLGPITIEPYFHEVQRACRQLGIEKKVTVVPGYLPNDPRLASAYRAAHFFAFPTITEQFPMVILEAWASGLPVISSRVGGIPGFTREGKDILFFECNDEDGLLKQMLLLASNERERQKLIGGGNDSVKAYDCSSVAVQMTDLYKEVLTPIR